MDDSQGHRLCVKEVGESITQLPDGKRSLSDAENFPMTGGRFLGSKIEKSSAEKGGKSAGQDTKRFWRHGAWSYVSYTTIFNIQMPLTSTGRLCPELVDDGISSSHSWPLFLTVRCNRPFLLKETAGSSSAAASYPDHSLIRGKGIRSAFRRKRLLILK